MEKKIILLILHEKCWEILFVWAILVAFYDMHMAKQWQHSYAQHHMGP